MDDIYRATDQHQRSIDARLAARQQYQGTSATHCRDCEDPIPERRRVAIAGCQRCASCQQDHERRSRP